MSNRRYIQFYETPHKKPVQIDCQFVVDSTNALGIKSLKGAGIENVFMHTTATPGFGNGSFLNPNPAAGNIIVQFADNYQYLISMYDQMTPPLSGSDLAVNASALTVGVAYVITVLGTTTAADWVALGVPAGITPAVGVAFIAAVVGTGSGSGKVQIPKSGYSAIGHIELIGNPQTTITTGLGAPLGQLPGPYIVLQALNGSDALTAPADGTGISMVFLFQDSFIQNNGY